MFISGRRPGQLWTDWIEMRVSPLILLAISAVLLFVGIYSGEPAAVWQKAVTICLSCIGIG